MMRKKGGSTHTTQHIYCTACIWHFFHSPSLAFRSFSSSCALDRFIHPFACDRKGGRDDSLFHQNVKVHVFGVVLAEMHFATEFILRARYLLNKMRLIMNEIESGSGKLCAVFHDTLQIFTPIKSLTID